MKTGAKTITIKRLAHFGITGGIAALVHLVVAVILVSKLDLAPLIANIIAFLAAFSVSFYGHSRWTFRDINSSANKTLIKFFITASISFILNETMFAYMLSKHQIPYYFSLIIVLAMVSTITFIISRYWAFK